MSLSWKHFIFSGLVLSLSSSTLPAMEEESSPSPKKHKVFTATKQAVSSTIATGKTVTGLAIIAGAGATLMANDVAAKGVEGTVNRVIDLTEKATEKAENAAGVVKEKIDEQVVHLKNGWNVTKKYVSESGEKIYKATKATGEEIVIKTNEAGKGFFRWTTRKGKEIFGQIKNLRVTRLLTNNLSHKDIIAVVKFKKEIKKFFLGKNITVTAKDLLESRWVKGKSTEFKTELLQYGKNEGKIADLNKTNKTGDTALHSAVKKGDKSSMKALIDAGANLNIQDAHGKTALHHAINQDSGPMTQALLDNGADATIKDNKGFSAHHLGQRSSNEHIRNRMTHV